MIVKYETKTIIQNMFKSEFKHKLLKFQNILTNISKLVYTRSETSIYIEQVAFSGIL